MNPYPEIEYYDSHLAGNRCARCTGCGTMWAYWDEPEDLTHECWMLCPCCSGQGEYDPIWDEDTHTHTRNVCTHCGGIGAHKHIVEG
jgi:DnaJ-class molecular chaperone